MVTAPAVMHPSIEPVESDVHLYQTVEASVIDATVKLVKASLHVAEGDTLGDSDGRDGHVLSVRVILAKKYELEKHVLHVDVTAVEHAPHTFEPHCALVAAHVDEQLATTDSEKEPEAKAYTLIYKPDAEIAAGVTVSVSTPTLDELEQNVLDDE